jgi:hypothetical protein
MQRGSLAHMEPRTGLRVSATALDCLPNHSVTLKRCLKVYDIALRGCLTAWRCYAQSIKNSRCCLYDSYKDNFHRVKLYHHAFPYAAAYPPLSGSRSRLLVHRFQHSCQRHCTVLHTQLQGIWLSLRFSAISRRPHDKSYTNDRITILRVRECHRIILD